MLRRLLFPLSLALVAQLLDACTSGTGENAGRGAEALTPDVTPGVVTNASDTLRTGWYPDEALLDPATVGSPAFGQLFSTTVDGQIYAQPLVANDTLFVVTESNHVYSLDPDTGAIRASRALDGTPWNSADVGCADLQPSIGVTGTPVIDPTTNTAYFLAKTYVTGASGAATWAMHAVDLVALAEQPGFPVTIQGTPTNSPGVAFDPVHEHQRTGLLLLDGVVYAGFGSHCDAPAYTGYIAGVSTSGQLSTLWTTEQGGAMGAGVWQGGGGLVSDGPGQILFATGNGTSPAAAVPGTTPPGALAEAVVRLTVQADGSLQATDFFMPYNAAVLNQEDLDLGSGGSVGLPDSFGTTAVPHLLAEIGKEGYLYLLDRDNLGGFMQGAAGGDAFVARVGPDGGGMWGRPSVWPGDGGYVYTVTNAGAMNAYASGVDDSGKPALSLAGSTADTFGYTSGSPVVTSDGTASGSALVWVVWSSGPTGVNAQLRAYDAVPVSGVLTQCFGAAIGTASKFAQPGIANGKVYVGTRDGTILAFGAPTSAPLQSAPTSFGPVLLTQSSTEPVTFTANVAVTIDALASSDPEFVVGAATPPLPAVLAAGDTLAVSLTFAPTHAGLRAASIEAITTAGSEAFPASGYGQTQAPDLLVAPTSLSLGGVAVGSTLTGTITLSNAGIQPLVVSTVTLPSPPFSVSGLPVAGGTIAPGGSVIATVTYTPSSTGTFQDAIGLTTNGGNASVSISATSAAPGHLVYSTTYATTGNIALGGSGLASFQITNTGGEPVVVSKSKAPSDPAFTVFSDIPEGSPVGPGVTLTATVRFTPTAVGLVEDAWTMNADDDSGLQVITLDGNGVASIASPVTAAWQVNGDAALEGASLLLTPPTDFALGSAFFPTAVASGSLTVNFDADIGGGTGADGLTLILADPSSGATPTSLGAYGGGLGFSGIPGVAIALDTYQNAVNPSANFVGLTDGAGTAADLLHWLATASSIPNLRSGTRHVAVTVLEGTVSVAIDGLPAFSATATLPPTVLVGFTGGCGGLTDNHAVSNVSISTDPITATP